MIDASNAFKQINRSEASHSIQIKCKEMAHYVINTYRSPLDCLSVVEVKHFHKKALPKRIP